LASSSPQFAVELPPDPELVVAVGPDPATRTVSGPAGGTAGRGAGTPRPASGPCGALADPVVAGSDSSAGLLVEDEVVWVV
jgi:hypothetical protein